MAMTTRALLATLTIALAAPAHARPIWQDTVQEPGLEGTAFAVVAGADAVFVGGVVYSSAPGPELVLRSYEPQSGQLLWEDRDGAADSSFNITDLTVLGSRLFASVATVVPSGLDPGGPLSRTSHDLIRAYDASSGNVLWQADFDHGAADDILGLVATGTHAVAVGRATRDDGQQAFAVRAYDAATGALAWHEEITNAGFPNQATSVVATADRLYVAGTVDANVHVRAYDPVDGTVLWAKDSPFAGYVLKVVTSGGHVVVAAYSEGTLTLRAYDAGDGTLLWERQDVPLGPVSDRYPITDLGVTASDSAVFTAVRHDLRPDSILSAYDPDTGAVLWQNDHTDVQHDLTFDRGRLFAASSSEQGFRVRSFDAASGAPLWTDALVIPAIAVAIAPRDGEVFVAGELDNGLHTFYVAAFDARPQPVYQPIRRGVIRLPNFH